MWFAGWRLSYSLLDMHSLVYGCWNMMFLCICLHLITDMFLLLFEFMKLWPFGTRSDERARWTVHVTQTQQHFMCSHTQFIIKQGRGGIFTFKSMQRREVMHWFKQWAQSHDPLFTLPRPLRGSSNSDWPRASSWWGPRLACRGATQHFLHVVQQQHKQHMCWGKEEVQTLYLKLILIIIIHVINFRNDAENLQKLRSLCSRFELKSNIV